MKRLLLLAVIVISSLVPAHAEMSKEKKQEIEKMLQLTGMEKTMTQMKNQMISSIKDKFTKLPDSFWDKVQKEMDMRGLLEQIIPLYDKYYTLEDLKAVNGFYQSPAGQKIISTMPQIMQESMKIGQEWGERVVRKVTTEAEKESQKSPE